MNWEVMGWKVMGSVLKLILKKKALIASVTQYFS
jgi:hypothetical protein